MNEIIILAWAECQAGSARSTHTFEQASDRMYRVLMSTVNFPNEICVLRRQVGLVIKWSSRHGWMDDLIAPLGYEELTSSDHQ